MTDRIKQFIESAEDRCNRSIDECYKNLDMLYSDLDSLNNSLYLYRNKRLGNTEDRIWHIMDIRNQIPKVYEDINFFKECINAEKREIARIRSQYLENSSDFNLQEDEFEEIKGICYNTATGYWEQTKLVQ